MAGKFDSDIAKLMMVVIGCSRTGRRDLRRLVGIQSRAQVESVAEFYCTFNFIQSGEVKIMKGRRRRRWR